MVQLGPDSKRGLLQNATQSQFMKYHNRLKEMASLMNKSTDLQTNLMQKLSEIGSQDPVSLGGIDVEDDVEEYIKNSGKSAPAEAPPAK